MVCPITDIYQLPGDDLTLNQTIRGNAVKRKLPHGKPLYNDLKPVLDTLKQMQLYYLHVDADDKMLVCILLLTQALVFMLLAFI